MNSIDDAVENKSYAATIIATTIANNNVLLVLAGMGMFQQFQYNHNHNKESNNNNESKKMHY